MKTWITVREYARLTTENVAEPSLDCAQISLSAFDWLCNLSATFGRSGATLIQVEERRWLKLDNYVGVIETPCGTRLEILPKHTDEGASIASSRKLLRRMIATAMDLPVRVANETTLQLFDVPLSEWVMRRFLESLDHLIKRGARSDYIRVGGAERYLRGQLDLVRQMRQPLGRQHIFQIRHDVFELDCPENRLLKSALDIVCKRVQLPENWCLAQKLRTLMHEFPTSQDFESDFKRWRNDRLMAHYQSIRLWCELTLYRQMPFSLSGQWYGISMLFPMEKLFEHYVAAALRASLPSDAKLVRQVANQWMCSHNEKPMFRLQPDILIEHRNVRWVLDTKWKLINERDRRSNYQISQSDLYQMFAYGHRYLAGAGDIFLIYPKHDSFTGQIGEFCFDTQLRLHVLAFDLDLNRLDISKQCVLPCH